MGFGQTGARSPHDAGEAAREFADAIRLVEQHGFAGDKFFADAKSRGTGEQIVRGVLLGDATTGDERDIGKRATKRTDVTVCADEGAGK